MLLTIVFCSAFNRTFGGSGSIAVGIIEGGKMERDRGYVINNGRLVTLLSNGF